MLYKYSFIKGKAKYCFIFIFMLFFVVLGSNLILNNIIISFETNSSEKIFRVNTANNGTVSPLLIVHSPLNGSVVGAFPPDFNITITSSDFDEFWFKFNTSDTIYRWVVNPGNRDVWIPYTEWAAIPEGHILVEFFANNTAGTVFRVELRMIKEISKRSSGDSIPGFDLISLSIAVITTLGLIVSVILREIREEK